MALVHKYRPKIFKNVVGQQAATGILSGMIKNGKLPPTLLMTGPRGVGKTTCARILASRANCSNPKGDEPCTKCTSCKTKNHPDVLELNCADKRGIDQIRHLGEISRLVPQFKHRVFILDEAHSLTAAAFEATLKMFEEPPPTSTFILVTTTPQKLPKTILSRSQKIVFSLIGKKTLAKHIFSIAKKEKFSLSQENALKIARASGGFARDAVHLLEQVISYSKSNSNGELPLDNVVEDIVKESPINVTITFMAALLKSDIEDAFTLVDKIDNHEYFIKSCIDLLRSLIRAHISPSVVAPHLRWTIKKLPRVPLQTVLVCLELFIDAYQQLKNYTISGDVLLDMLLAKMERSKT